MADEGNKIDTVVKGILDEAYGRYKAAEKQYGVLDVNKDPRNFLQEAEEELLDFIAYAAFEIVKIRNLNNRLNDRLRAMLPAIRDNKVSEPAQPIIWPGTDGF